MYAPATDDEITGLTAYVDQQLTALRASIVGLTDEQARARPCRSALSIGGLLKHVAHGMRGATDRLASGVHERPVDEATIAAYQGSFSLTEEETGAGVLDAFDRARVEYLAAIAATDPAADITEPPAPWHGIFEPRPAAARYLLVHQVEEMARHAGHADLLREELDGVSVPRIVLSLEGAPANDFFEPYVPAPGTIGA